jgi:hypothetical protein
VSVSQLDWDSELLLECHDLGRCAYALEIICGLLAAAFVAALVGSVVVAYWMWGV